MNIVGRIQAEATCALNLTACSEVNRGEKCLSELDLKRSSTPRPMRIPNAGRVNSESLGKEGKP